MPQQASERIHASISSTDHSSPSTAEGQTRSAVRRGNSSRRRVRALLGAGGALTAAAGLALTALTGPSVLTDTGLASASEKVSVTASDDASVDFKREPITPSSPSATPAEESKVTTLSDGKPTVAGEEAAPTEKKAEAPAKEQAEAPTKEPEESGLAAPLSEVSVASPYGNRVNPMGGYAQEMHTGTDFAGACGTPVLASDAGTVVESGWHPYGGGQRIVIDHGDGLKTTYNHLSSLGTAVGEKIEREQPIGAVGTTGNSTGCHLHFEVVVDGKTVDPSGHL